MELLTIPLNFTFNRIVYFQGYIYRYIMGNSSKKPFDPSTFDIDDTIEIYTDKDSFGISDYQIYKMLNRCLSNFAQVNFDTDPEHFLHEGCGVIAVLLEITSLSKVKKNPELWNRYNNQAEKLKRRLQRKLQTLIHRELSGINKQVTSELHSLDAVAF